MREQQENSIETENIRPSNAKDVPLKKGKIWSTKLKKKLWGKKFLRLKVEKKISLRAVIWELGEGKGESVRVKVM